MNRLYYFLLIFFVQIKLYPACKDLPTQYVTQILKPFPKTDPTIEVSIETPFPYKSLSEAEREITVCVPENYCALIGKDQEAQQALIGPCRPCVAVAVYTNAGQVLVFHKHIKQSSDEAIIRQTTKTLAETKSTIIGVKILTQALFAEEAQKRHHLTLQEQRLKFERLKIKLINYLMLKTDIIDETFIERSLNPGRYFFGSDNTFLITTNYQETFSTSLYQGTVIPFTKHHALNNLFFKGYVDLTKEHLEKLKKRYEDQSSRDFSYAHNSFILSTIHRGP